MVQEVVRELTKCVPVIKEVVKEVEVIKEVPVEVVKWEAVKVPAVKIVEVSRAGVPQLYQRTGGGYKVWDFGKGPMGDINEDLFRGVLSPLDRATQRRMNALGLEAPSGDGRCAPTRNVAIPSPRSTLPHACLYVLLLISSRTRMHASYLCRF